MTASFAITFKCTKMVLYGRRALRNLHTHGIHGCGPARTCMHACAQRWLQRPPCMHARTHRACRWGHAMHHAASWRCGLPHDALGASCTAALHHCPGTGPVHQYAACLLAAHHMAIQSWLSGGSFPHAPPHAANLARLQSAGGFAFHRCLHACTSAYGCHACTARHAGL